MIDLGYYNGAYGRIEDIAVPMSDRGCYFGDGVYDATYAHNHIPFALQEHVKRFYASAAALDIKLDMKPEELDALLRRMTKKLDSGDTFVYWQATRGAALRDHTYPDNMRSNLWIMIKNAPIKDLSRAVKVQTALDTRYYHCNIKTLNLIPNVMYSKSAQLNGCYETVLHRNGQITECAHSNVGMIKDGVFVTAPTSNLILAGVARAHIKKMCPQVGLRVEERPWTVDELFTADEIIVSSAGSLALRVSHVNNKEVGGKAESELKTLQEALLEEFWTATEGK